MMQTTLVYILKNDQVLLAMKKRSFGAGKWNGPGGKVHPGESVREAACREVMEEVGLTVTPEGLQEVGFAEFIYEAHPEVSTRCFIFLAKDFSGEPRESDEMRPAWFSLSGLPWDTMWESDKVWLESVLRGEAIFYRFSFDADKKLQMVVSISE